VDADIEDCCGCGWEGECERDRDTHKHVDEWTQILRTVVGVGGSESVRETETHTEISGTPTYANIFMHVDGWKRALRTVAGAVRREYERDLHGNTHAHTLLQMLL